MQPACVEGREQILGLVESRKEHIRKVRTEAVPSMLKAYYFFALPGVLAATKRRRSFPVTLASVSLADDATCAVMLRLQSERVRREPRVSYQYPQPDQETGTSDGEPVRGESIRRRHLPSGTPPRSAQRIGPIACRIDPHISPLHVDGVTARWCRP